MVRVILQVNVRTPTEENFDRLKWVSIKNMWNYFKCKMIYSVLENQTPVYILQMIQKSQYVHNIRTRRLILPKIKT